MRPTRRRSKTTMGAAAGDKLTGRFAQDYGWPYAVRFWAVCAFIGAVVIANSRLAEQIFYPLIIASQTIPILAIAPMIIHSTGPPKRTRS